MKTRILNSLAVGSLLLGSQLLAQIGPNIGNAVQQNVQDAVQSAVERQVERAQTAAVEQAQNAAVERVVERAEAAAASQVLDRAEAVQADLVQNQTLEQVQNQVERVQAQAAEQAQTQIDRVQEQATGQAQATVDRVQAQVEMAQGQVEQVQTQLERLPGQAAQYVPATAQSGIERAAEAAGTAASAVAAAVPDSAPGQGAPAQNPPGGNPGDPQGGIVRQAVNAANGNAVFVEITLPDGARAVEFEWVMIVTPEERARLDGEAAELLTYLTDTQPFALADDGELLTFTVPPDLDANEAILDLVPDNMRDLIDRNHIYDTQDDDNGSGHLPGPAPLSLPMPAVCTEPVKLGMIDSSIDTAHPAFAATGAVITQRSFVDAQLPQSTAHGTAVAGLLVGRDNAEEKSGSVLHPLLPAAALYSASVFHANEGATQGATVMRILSALDWLLQQDEVRVINMSLAGPSNRLLERAVGAASEKGRVIVAAVGNDGPYGPVRYPAAYDAAIGVTAVARDAGIFRFANQGAHIDYAALGVEVPTARAAGGFGPESGTSLAAPVVAAFIACELARSGDVHQALAALDARARDIGVPGTDPVFGRGLLHP